jgi:DNA segregation ATPase FtsK/SpoIIIE, S-DNA-T family
VVKPADVSFEIELDEEPTPGPPVVMDQPTTTPTRRPIISAHPRTREGVKTAVKKTADRNVYRLGYHSLRSPRYAALAVAWGAVGVIRVVGKQLRWWWVTESSALKWEAIKRHDFETWMKLHREGKATRRARSKWLLLEVMAVCLGIVLILQFAPWWVPWVLGLVALPVLARIGRPEDKPILTAAVVTPRHRKLNADVVLRAYYSAGLGDPSRADQKIEFGTIISRDVYNAGSQVVVRLPYGKTFSDALKAKEKLASGLDVALSQVHLTPEKDSNRSHLLWVADVDPLSIPAGRTPLLDCKPRDIWKPCPIGIDERNRRVAFVLVFYSLLVGAQPRKGKTFTARLIALFAALDPYVRLSVFDGKGSPDWRAFALVAYTFGFGLLPDRKQGDPVENLLATLRSAKKDVQERNAKLAELPSSICPEGKLTREIARNPKYGMPVWVIVIDEFQEYLVTGDKERDEEIAELLVFLIKVGPSVGIVMLDATQKPSGIGGSQKTKALFTDFRDQHQARFALKTGNRHVSDAILGGSASADGWDSSDLPVGDEFRGVGLLYDAPVDNCTVRTYLADGQDAEKILTAARKHRERVGTLSGMAVGETVAVQIRDPLGDALDAFRGEESELSWGRLADRLAELQPERYADTSGDALSATLRGLKLGIQSVNVRDQEYAESGVAKGVKRSALVRAIESRDKA